MLWKLLTQPRASVRPTTEAEDAALDAFFALEDAEIEAIRKARIDESLR